MKNEFTLAFNEVLEEKGLPKEIILKALESAMISAYRRSVNASAQQHVEATVDIETGKVTIYAEKEVVDQVENPVTEVSLEDAQKVQADAEVGSLVIVETTPGDFGRVAAHHPVHNAWQNGHCHGCSSQDWASGRQHSSCPSVE